MLLGKLDGKVDVILSQSVKHSERMDQLEKHLRDTETRVDRIETQAKSKAGLVSSVSSVIAVVISIGGFVKGIWFK